MSVADKHGNWQGSPTVNPGGSPARGAWRKFTLINYLVRMRGYRRYLEICTPTTGRRYAAINRDRLAVCHRLMYRCAAGSRATDGLPIQYRSDTVDVSDCVDVILGRSARYDVILVDPFHLYETTRRDLEVAVRLLEPGGTVVVHDCSPYRREWTEPEFRRGPWFGATYRAYIDFVLAREDLAYCTVDIDCGCGILRSADSRAGEDPKPTSGMLSRPSLDPGLIDAWCGIGDDYVRAYDFFDAHRAELLQLCSLDAFRRREIDERRRRRQPDD